MFINLKERTVCHIGFIFGKETDTQDCVYTVEYSYFLSNVIELTALFLCVCFFS